MHSNIPAESNIYKYHENELVTLPSSAQSVKFNHFL